MTAKVKSGHQGARKVKGMELHGETSTHASKILSQNVGSTGGNHLLGADDDFASAAPGSYGKSR